jgi:hypothetical protein
MSKQIRSAISRSTAVTFGSDMALRLKLFLLLIAGLVAYFAATIADAEQTDQSKLVAAASQRGAAATDPANSGIWKAATPPRGTMHGEFENNDPFGLSAGVKIAADCSLNWVDPDSAKLYCFSSATSLVYFLDAPQSYLLRARNNWESMSGMNR